MTAVLWAETGHCKEEGGYEQSTRGRGGLFYQANPKNKMTAAESKRVPLLTPQNMYTHGFPTPSALMCPDWMACQSFSVKHQSIFLSLSLSLSFITLIKTEFSGTASPGISSKKSYQSVK